MSNTVILGDVCNFINGGAWSDKEYVSAGIPVLKVSNFKPSGFSLEDVSRLPPSSLEKYEKNLLQTGDMVIATVGSHPNLINSAAGRSCSITDEVAGYLLNQNAVCVRTINSNVLDQRYLTYFGKSFYFQHYIQSRGRGAANQMRIAISAIKDYQFELPEIAIQRRIGDILSAYDDLIENNQKQIKLLEETATRLYKEWFVYLRFPGHENTPIVDGVPEGWTRISVKKALAMYIGGGWGKESATGKYAYKGKVIRGTDINDIKAGNFSSVPERYHTENDLEKRTLQHYDLVFELSNGNIDNIGRCLFIDKLVLTSCGGNAICASFCKLLRPQDMKTAIILYHEISDMQSSGRMSPLKKNGANGINNFDFDGFLEHHILLPDDDKLIILFNSIMTKISNIQRQVLVLREARDRLLPKLMSGEIEV